MVCCQGKIFNSVSYTMLRIGAYRERVIFSCPCVSWVDFRRYLILIFVGNMTFHSLYKAVNVTLILKCYKCKKHKTLKNHKIKPFGRLATHT